jgi:hypothetical protein
MPPTPPPDIDVDAWHRSVDLVAGWRPRRLALTHWGTVEDPEPHLARLHEELDAAVALARRTDDEGYARAIAERLAGTAAEAAYLQAAPPETLRPGLARWLRVSSQ